jgi:hypothetical protein
MAAGSEPENRVRGVAFGTFEDVMRSTKGEEMFARLLDHEAVAEFADTLRKGLVVKSAWYPIAWYRALHRAARDVTVDPSFARAVGRISTRDDLTGGFLKFVVRMLSPQTLVKVSSTVFNRYYETGRMQIIEARDGYTRARWTGCRGFDHAIWEDVLGGCEGGLEAAGATNLRGRIVSGGRDGDDDAECDVSWK